jgi:Nucleoid-associated protein
MPLTHFIAHRVQRLSPTEPSHVHCRESVFTLNGKIEEVFRELKQSYLKRLGKQYGRFSEDIGQFPLSSWLRELNEEKIDFARFSELLLKQLKTVFDSGEFALEGLFFYRTRAARGWLRSLLFLGSSKSSVSVRW